MTLTPPDPRTTRSLAALAVASYGTEPDKRSRTWFTDLVTDVTRRLASPAAVPALSALPALAAEIGGQDGDLPLLGTGLRADTYDALLWNAVRCGAEDTPDAALLLAGMSITGDLDLKAAASSEDLCRAVTAGRTVTETAETLVPPGPLPARPSTGVLGTATTCALLTGADTADLAVVLDLAASLMLATADGHTDGDTNAGSRGQAGSGAPVVGGGQVRQWRARPVVVSGLVVAAGPARAFSVCGRWWPGMSARRGGWRCPYGRQG